MYISTDKIIETRNDIVDDVIDLGSCMVGRKRLTSADWMEYFDHDDLADVMGMLLRDADKAKEFAKELMLGAFDCVISEVELHQYIKEQGEL